VPTIKVDLVADDRRGPPAKRVKWVEDFDLEPQTPGIMASPRMAVANDWTLLARDVTALSRLSPVVAHF